MPSGVGPQMQVELEQFGLLLLLYGTATEAQSAEGTSGLAR